MITFRQFAEHLERSAGQVDVVIHDIVIVVTNRAEIRARELIGEYQEPLGVLPGWAPLSGATLDGFHHSGAGWIVGKVDLGFAPPDNPLERTGETRDSIQGEAIGNTGVIGSPEKKMLWQELGTPNAEYPIPPRPVLARAVMEEIETIKALGGQAAMELLVPEGSRR